MKEFGKGVLKGYMMVVRHALYWFVLSAINFGTVLAGIVVEWDNFFILPLAVGVVTFALGCFCLQNPGAGTDVE